MRRALAFHRALPLSRVSDVPFPPSLPARQTDRLGAAPSLARVSAARVSASDGDSVDGETTTNTLVFPGLGDAAVADTAEFVSDELDPEALREVRTTARRMERQRERLESMKFGVDEKPLAEAGEKTPAEAEEKAPEKAPEKAEDAPTFEKVQEPAPGTVQDTSEPTSAGPNQEETSETSEISEILEISEI